MAQIIFLRGSCNQIRFCAQSLPLHELGWWIIRGNESDAGPIFQNVKNQGGLDVTDIFQSDSFHNCMLVGGKPIFKIKNSYDTKFAATVPLILPLLRTYLNFLASTAQKRKNAHVLMLMLLFSSTCSSIQSSEQFTIESHIKGKYEKPNKKVVSEQNNI